MDNTPQNLSPVVTDTVETQASMSFSDALKEVLKGNRVTRLSWATEEKSYGLMIHDILTLHLKGKFSQWILSTGDMEATDWVIFYE